MKNYLFRASFAVTFTETYKKYPTEKLVGYFRGSRPELVIRDPVIAKRVLSVDFNCFHRRGLITPTARKEPLDHNQVVSDDDLWRLLRIRMTPAFTSCKIEAMVPLILERAERLQSRLLSLVDETIDTRDLMARFTTGVIGTVGFGAVSKSLTNDNDAMRLLALKLCSSNFPRLLRQTLRSLIPGICGRIKVSGDEEKDILKIVQSIMEHRNWEPSGRHDFIDLLLESKKQGAITGYSMVEVNEDGTPKKVSIEMDLSIMAAQSYAFLIAGFEPSSTASSYTLHQLAHNPHIQQKVQEEIDRVLSRHETVLSYDAISEMTYLRWCLDEAIRMFPSVGFLQRHSVRPYTFPDTKVTIDAGVTVIIPLAAYQNDPTIFPNPIQFRPERFDPAAVTAVQRMAYMPFGGGPRACIVLSWGSPSLPPVLLVHGFVDTAATFLPLVAAMPAEYHYVTFDLPGHGRSDTLLGPPISYLHLVEAVRQIVDQMRWDTFYCIAHSMGYLISAFYNAAYPGRIRRLVSVAGAVSIQLHGLVEHPDQWFDISYASYYRRYCPPPPPVSYTYEDAVKSLAAARRLSKEHAVGLATRCLQSVDGRVTFTWDVKAKKISVPAFLEDMIYAAISIPVSTLCLVPTEDETPITFREYHDNMLGRLASARFVLVDVPGGHSVHLTNPEHVVPHIVRFFNEDSTKSKL